MQILGRLPTILKLKIAHLVVVILCGPALMSFSQSLLTETHLVRQPSGGGPVYYSSLALRVCMATTPRSTRSYLFEDLSFVPSDVGKTFTVSAANDPDFGAFTALFTDGIQSYFMFDDQSGGSLLPELGFFPVSALPPGNNGVDLGGFQIDYCTLYFNSFEWTTLSTDPAGNPTWAEYSYDATFSVHGSPVTVPEPASITVLGIFALFSRIRHLRILTKPETMNL